MLRPLPVSAAKKRRLQRLFRRMYQSYGQQYLHVRTFTTTYVELARRGNSKTRLPNLSKKESHLFINMSRFCQCVMLRHGGRKYFEKSISSSRTIGKKNHLKMLQNLHAGVLPLT